MKLKTRLIVSFFIIILVPMALVGLAFIGYGKYQIRAIERRYDITGVTYDSLSNSMQLISKLTQKVFEDIREQELQDVDKILDKEYLDEINSELQKKDSYLIIRIDDKAYYSGTDKDVSKIITELPDFGDARYNSDSGFYVGQDVKSFVKQADVTLTNGSKGSIFIITEMEDAIPQIKEWFRNLILMTILILMMTAFSLITWIYRSINKPVKRLQVATQKIKDGNLDYVLEIDGEDEFSELCQDFEEMRQRLQESAEEKLAYDEENRELISNISHDLKTPITAVKGYVEGLMDGVADTPEKVDKYVRTIYNKANEMDRLINELTFYSKIDTNRIPYTFNKINVTEYFDDCIEEVGLDLEAKGIALSYFNNADKEATIIADAEQIKRVINNIISNSVKYIDKQRGYINIRVKDVGDFIQVEIEDNGKGIAAKDLPAIFDRFYRTDTSRNSSQGGSGIGLSIVKKIVEDHGGKIWASSKLESGTIMYFVLRKYQEVPTDE